MELVLPQNYVEIEQEEMEYLDGGGVGYNWWNNAKNVGTALDVIFSAAGFGVGIYNSYALKKFLRQNANKAVKMVYSKIVGYAGMTIGGFVAGIANLVMTAIGTSLGQIMSNVLDRIDGRYDGYLWA
ncbi:hypothetical protein ABGF49_05645 [Helcococcus ovis]|uniref:Argininosuccinate lyase n=1 Tax=Helcococcus ovis TaxID=72026 RepID=A0A4R9C2A2_9FIRM|nr:argininosuccinate lyase [Helcococcus ovis]TFF63910.1 argininosuccinate lyase [Helcococcus ovis]TFF66135.1 argininosuccinate lyase [Helcococcus ovis]TFF67016.1 argininosuccinate lyase [Helcococcus ovis]WNZ01353.1 hypothetical protein EQF90_000440 [Helcococcus ovis]